MTAANGPVVFNASTGSDTAASGLGPSTAVTGTGASLNATTTVDLSADSPDLSGVTAGDLLWVQSSSGLQFSVIASVDDVADTVTVDIAYTVTESSRTWAIGGKRATFDNASSRRLFVDWNTLVMDIETETDQALTSKLDFQATNVNGRKHIYGSAGGIKTLEQTANDYHFYKSAGNSLDCDFSNIRFTNSNATKNSSNRVWASVLASIAGVYSDCVFGDATDSIDGFIYDQGGNIYCQFSRCTFQHTGGKAIDSNGSLFITCTDCFFDSCNGGCHQISTQGGQHGGIYVRCIFKDIALDAIKNNSVHNQVGLTVVDSCIFDNCGQGIYSQRRPRHISINNSIFIDCTTAIRFDFGSSPGFMQHQWRGNAFYNNTTDYTIASQIENTMRVKVDAITLTTDPFVDKANGDYNLNADAGGGAVLRSNNYTVGG